VSDYYKFITQQSLSPRKPKVVTGPDSVEAIEHLIKTTPEVVHYDLETTGLSFQDIHQEVTTIGIATPTFLIGIDLLDVDKDSLASLWKWLSVQKLGGFNLSFDLAWPWREEIGEGRVEPNVKELDIVSDTALWFRLLATEGHPQQSHNLETLVDKVLGWPEEFQQKAWLKEALIRHNIKKKDMWRLALAEPKRYTAYCALDAEASLQADKVFKALLEDWHFTGLTGYHDMILGPKIKRTIKETCYGIKIDRERIKKNIQLVKERMISLEAKAYSHPKFAGGIEEFTRQKLEKQHELKFNVKKTWAKKVDEPWNYPDIYRIHPTNIDKLPAWCKPFGGKFYKAELQFNITNKKAEWPRFNVNSTDDMKWLIYTYWLDNSQKIWYRNAAKPNYGGLVTITTPTGDKQVDLTASGALPTGGDILTLFGDIGQILNEYKSLKTLLNNFLEKFELASQRTGYIHAQSKILGTISGRASGGAST